MSLSARVAQNYIIQIISKVIATALGLVGTAIIARYLGQSGFGEYTVIITFISFFAILADLGLTLVTVQMISRPGADEQRILSNLLGLRLVSAVIFLGLAPIAVLFFPYSAQVKAGILAASLSFFFIALMQVLVGLFQKNLALSKVSIAEVASRIVLVVGIVTVARLDLGLVNIIWTMVLASFVNFIILYFYSREFVLIKLKFEAKIWREILTKTWPLATTIGFNLIYLKADTLILSLIKTEAEVGLYGAAYKIIETLITLPFIFAGIVLPILTATWAKAQAQNNQKRFKEILQKSFDVMAIFALPLMIGTQFLAEPVMILVAGIEFIEAGSILRVLILASGIIFLQVMSAHAIIAFDKQKKIIPAYIFVSLTALAGYLIFIPKYSYFGAAWVTIYSELAIGFASFYLVWKYTKFLPNIKVFLKSMFASLVMGGALYFIKDFNLLASLFLAGTIYAGALYALKGLDFVPISKIIKNSKTNN